jgi:Tfp pilus assembly protein PilW
MNVFNRKRNAGVGLVEMMVAMTAGLIVSGAAVQFLTSTIRSNSEFVRSAVFTQDLRSTHEYVVRDLRRAGYDENAMKYIALAEGSEITSPFAPMQIVNEDQADSCAVYAYDSAAARTGANTGPGFIDTAAGEIRAMRRMVRNVNGRNVGVIEVAQTGPGLTALDCTAAGPDYTSYPSVCNAATGWCALTDARQLDITSFRLTDESVWNGPAASRFGSKVREVVVTIEGGLIGNQGGYQRAVTTSVRVRAECLRPVAATEDADTTGTLCNTAPGA